MCPHALFLQAQSQLIIKGRGNCFARKIVWQLFPFSTSGHQDRSTVDDSQALDIWYFMCWRHFRASGSLKSHHSLTQAVLWSPLNHCNVRLMLGYYIVELKRILWNIYILWIMTSSLSSSPKDQKWTFLHFGLTANCLRLKQCLWCSSRLAAPLLPPLTVSYAVTY